MFISGQRKGVTRAIRKELKRRSAIEPEIGHMKSDGHLGRCFLKGVEGDAVNVILAAAEHNLRKILNWLRYFAHLIPVAIFRITGILAGYQPVNVALT
jgi:IS5 family transposase